MCVLHMHVAVHENRGIIAVPLADHPPRPDKNEVVCNTSTEAAPKCARGIIFNLASDSIANVTMQIKNVNNDM